MWSCHSILRCVCCMKLRKVHTEPRAGFCQLCKPWKSSVWPGGWLGWREVSWEEMSVSCFEREMSRAWGVLQATADAFLFSFSSGMTGGGSRLGSPRDIIAVTPEAPSDRLSTHRLFIYHIGNRSLIPGPQLRFYGNHGMPVAAPWQGSPSKSHKG